MKIVAVQGSPRPEGNTQALLDLVLRGARESGAGVEVIQLSEFRNIVGCEECYGCKSGEAGAEATCLIDDDMQEILGKLLAADTIVWSTPIFAWTPSWLLKIAIDRLYCLFSFGDGHDVRSRLAGRGMAGVFTSAGPVERNCDLTTTALERLADFAGCTWRGAHAVGEVTDRAALLARDDVRNAAVAFGRQLAQGARAADGGSDG